LNLMINAVEAMNTAQYRMLSVQSRMSKPDTILVSIEDTGTGINPADLPRLFQPLFTTKSGGMGMGLSICQSIIQRHHGRIWATPRKVAGSTFQFELPVKPM
jgi:signal transduction histidine kinase